MSGRFWRSLVATAAVLLSSTPVSAQGAPIDVVDCARDALDLDTLRLRLDLELGDVARASLEEGGDHRLVIRRECRSTEVTVRVEDLVSGLTVERVVDLADTRGAGRSWALALVIGDLFERGQRVSERPLPVEPEPVPEPELDAQPPTNGFVSWRMERPYITAPQPVADTDSPSSFRVGAASRLYFSDPTLLGGGYVGVQVDWVGLRVVALGTSSSDYQAELTGAMVLVEGALRAVELEDPVYRFGLHFTITGGLVHSEQALVEGETETLSGATIGAGARAGLTAIFSPELEGDVNLSVGYDVGQAMVAGVGDARGIYLGLDLGLRLPL